MSLAVRTRTGVKHSGTNVGNEGGALAPRGDVIVETDAGARTTDGSLQTIQNDASTSQRCRTGDIVKYVNIHLQVAPRSEAADENSRSGWIEYAFVCIKESDTVIPITNLGVKTLGDVATKMFRNECIWTGQIPFGYRQPNSVDLTIKIPKFKTKLRIGDQWLFYTYMRDIKATSTDTDAARVITSYNYKCYS